MLHRKHFVALLYAVAGGLITAAVMQAYQTNAGPQRVVVANADTIAQNLRGSDTLTRRYMEEMVGELRRIRESSVTQQGRGRALPGTNAGEASFPTDIINLPVLNRVNRPSAKGWTIESMNAFAVHRCPPARVPPKAEIDVALSLRNPAIAASLSPIEFSIMKRDARSRWVMIFDQQYEMQPNNHILITAPSESGNYEISIGFYVTADMKGDYPKRYVASCGLQVDTIASRREPDR